MNDDVSEGWDANGAPVPEPATPTHTCWICARRVARTHSGLWYSVWRAFQTGTLLVWTCCGACNEMAVTLIDSVAGYLDIR